MLLVVILTYIMASLAFPPAILLWGWFALHPILTVILCLLLA